jgi:hypothetical protein
MASMKLSFRIISYCRLNASPDQINQSTIKYIQSFKWLEAKECDYQAIIQLSLLVGASKLVILEAWLVLTIDQTSLGL